MSLAAVARRTHYSKALLGHLETGKRSVAPEHVAAYSRALGMSIEWLYGQSLNPQRIAHQWLVADAVVPIESDRGRRVGDTMADELEQRVIELRHLDDIVGGGDLFPVVATELAKAQDVVQHCSYSDTPGRRLLTTVGELAQLAGWVTSDAGKYVEAERVYLSGVSAAVAAGNDPLAGQLLSSLSYQVANVGEPADAALLARSAVKGARAASPIVEALLLERVAWASARARDHDGARRALDAVDDAFDRRSDGIEEPQWTYWLDRSEIDVMTARCMIELGNPAFAEPFLCAVIDGYSADHVRDRALYQTWLAEGYARSGDRDAGRAVLDKAAKLARKTNSARLNVRIAVIDRLLLAS